MSFLSGKDQISNYPQLPSHQDRFLAASVPSTTSRWSHRPTLFCPLAIGCGCASPELGRPFEGEGEGGRVRSIESGGIFLLKWLAVWPRRWSKHPLSTTAIGNPWHEWVRIRHHCASVPTLSHLLHPSCRAQVKFSLLSLAVSSSLQTSPAFLSLKFKWSV